jgi:hypothetical protein
MFFYQSLFYIFPIFFYSIIFYPHLGGIAYNVPAVYDIFASPGNRRFPGLAKMWVE